MSPGNPDERCPRFENREQIRSAFAQGIVCELDSTCRYRDVWATDERLLALPADELIGKTIVEAVGAEVGWPLMHGTTRVYRTGVPETFSYTLALADGPHAFEACVVRIADDGPEPYRAVALIRDVTSEKGAARSRILIIDDEPALLQILSAIVGEVHDVTVAGGSDAALAILAADRRFDAIICDLVMPLGGGASFYRRLADVAPELQDRVVFMTGGAFTPETQRFLDAFPDRTIAKPFELAALERAIGAMLRR